MNTQHFKYAIEVERTRSITQAADNLFMGQPNLSKAIKELEDTLGFAIFERTSKGVIPTRRGCEFLVYAQNILNQIEKMEALSNPGSADAQSLSISIPRGSYIANGFINFISALNVEYPIYVNVQETNSMQAINNITDGKFNLGVIRYQVMYENYFTDYLKSKSIVPEPIWEFESMALMSEKNNLAAQETLTYEALCEGIEIIHGDTIIPYLAEENEKRGFSHRQSRRIVLYERCNQFELLSNIPATFMWASPIPQNYLDRYQLVQRKCILPGKRFKDVLIYPKGYQFSSYDKLFIDKLYQAKNEVSFKEYF